MRKTAKENILVVCTVVLCFMLTLALCAYFSGEGLLSVFKEDELEGESIYAIVSGGYSDMSIARANAESVRTRGGAGYVRSGEEIEIVYAVYKDKAVAEEVMSSLGNKSVYISKIDLNEGKLKWCDKELKDDVVSALSYFDLTFDKLFYVSNKLNDGSMTIEDAKAQIRVLYTQIEDIKAEFYQQSNGYDDEQITQIKLALVTTLALLDNVDFSKNTALVTSSVRYQLVQSVFCRQALMNEM